MNDVIIIGNGPAGVTCGIYLKRFGYDVLIIGKDTGALTNDYFIENYYGIEKIKGADLINAGIKQATNLGIKYIKEEVVSIDKSDVFNVHTSSNNYSTKCLFLATGMKRNKLNIKNLSLYEGRGISYCAICDGFLYRKKSIALIGSKDYMLSELAVLKRFSSDITILTNGNNISFIDEKVINDEIISFNKEDNKIIVETKNNNYFFDAVFIADGSCGTSEIATHLGILLENNNIIVNDYQTNIKGVFAGGDAIGGLKQVVKAASDGANAAIAINKFLKGDKNE